MSDAKSNESQGVAHAMDQTIVQLRAVLDVSRALGEVTDEQVLLDLIAKSVCERLGFGLCVISMLDGTDIFRVRAAAAIDDREISERILGYTLSKAHFDEIRTHGVPLGKVLWIDGNSPLAKQLLESDEIYATTPSVRSTEWHPASVLFAPMELPDGTVIGFITPDDPMDGKLPSAASSIVLETLTYLATTAIELVRARATAATQIRVVEAQKQQVARLFEASTAVNRELQLEDMLTTAVRTMAEAGGFARVALYLVEGPSGRLSVRATFGLSDEEDRRLRMDPVDQRSFAPLMRPDMQISRSFLFDHLRHEIPDELLSKLSVPDLADVREEGCWHPLDSLNIPLVGEHDELLGIISVDEPIDGHFPDLSHIEALEYFADQCASAVSQVLRHRELTQMAETDPLTRLPNRRTFLNSLEDAIGAARRELRPLAVLFMDLDHFKAVNDTYGHLQGDRVLKDVATTLRRRLRKSDLLSRFGGEEFVAVLPNTSVKEATELAETLRRFVEASTIRLRGGVSVSVTVSVGVSGFSNFMNPPYHSAHLLGDLLLKTADAALYDAKTKGRNVVCVADPSEIMAS